MATTIVGQEHPALRRVAQAVPQNAIRSARVQKIIRTMHRALATCDDGIALAAPQIGESLRIFVLSPNAYTDRSKDKPLVFINPRITRLSKKRVHMEEGCLSLRWLYGEVERAERATIVAYDEKGRMFTRGASGLLAQAFQHEVDHLDGKLFIDTARKVRNIPPEPTL